jgi:hypothetical protein
MPLLKFEASWREVSRQDELSALSLALHWAL